MAGFENMNTKYMKQFTGDDEVYVRDHFPYEVKAVIEDDYGFTGWIINALGYKIEMSSDLFPDNEAMSKFGQDVLANRDAYLELADASNTCYYIKVSDKSTVISFQRGSSGGSLNISLPRHVGIQIAEMIMKELSD